MTDEELITVVVSVEQLLNSRPLTYQTANENDIHVLTPNHFLYGMLGDRLAPDFDSSEGLNARWRRVQQVVKEVWKRWMREWLPGQIPRKKWRDEKLNAKENNIVLVVDKDTPRGKWPLGRITKTFPSVDQRVRKVEVLIDGKKYIRPISRICVLNIE